MLTSSRYQIIYPNPTRGDSADVPRDIGALVVAVEQSAMYGQGTLATRPPSTAGTPGIQGRFYMATDQTPMVLYYDYGTGWASVGSISTGSIGTAQMADDSITGGPAGAGVKIKQLTITHDNIVAGTIRGGSGQEIAAGSITVASIAAALLPSGGAGAGTEALRAIGSGAGNVVAGNDARLTDQRTPLDNSVTTAKIANGTILGADINAATVITAGGFTTAGDITGTNNVFGGAVYSGTGANQLLVHRTPYGNFRHICVGYCTMPADTGSGASVSVSFDRAFTSMPYPTNIANSYIVVGCSVPSGSGITFISSGGGAFNFWYQAEGAS